MGSIQLCLTFGSLLAGIVNEFTSRRNDNSGWQIATALQAAPAVMILCMLFFTPNSPRWLVYKDRHEEALKTLKSLRPKTDVDNGAPEAELASMRDDHGTTNTRKGPWKDLFKGINRRRTGYDSYASHQGHGQHR